MVQMCAIDRISQTTTHIRTDFPMQPMQQEEIVLKIQKLHESLGDLEVLRKDYQDSKKELLKMRKKLEEMQTEREAISSSELKAEIRVLEAQYAQIFKKIDLQNIKVSTCLSIQDLESLFKSTRDKAILIDKCACYMKGLVTFHCFGREARLMETPECQGFSAVRISKEIEPFLALVEENGIGNQIGERLQLLIGPAMGLQIARSVVWFNSQMYIMIVYGDSLELERESFQEEEWSPASIPGLIANWPNTMNMILELLKNNLLRSITESNYNMEFILENNDMLKGTNAYIPNMKDKALDIAVKGIVALSKSKAVETPEAEDMVQSPSGRYISKRYFNLRSCFNIIKNIDSPRKEKAIAIANSVVSKFFNYDAHSDLRALFLIYADLCHCIESNPLADNIVDLKNLRELTFMDIIKVSTVFEIDFARPILMLKAQLRGMYCDFTENIDLFISESTKPIFIAEFFGTLYGRMIQLILKPKKCTAEELAYLQEAAEYASDLSFEHRRMDIDNVDILKCLRIILASSLTHVIQMYNDGDICLDKAKLRALVRMCFEPDVDRDRFIDSIY